MSGKSESQILCELLCEKARIQLLGSRGHRALLLTEPSCPDSQVYLKDIPDDAVVLKADAMPDTGKTIFNGQHGECQIADFAVICPEAKRVVFVELKNTGDTAVHRQQQLQGAACVFEYCRELVKAFWGKMAFLDGVSKHYVSFTHTNIRKRSTRSPRIEGSGLTPDQMRKVSFAPTVYFDSLWKAC